MVSRKFKEIAALTIILYKYNGSQSVRRNEGAGCTC